MRKTIKELENKLEHAEQSRDRYYQNWQKLEEENKKKESEMFFSLRNENGELRSQVSNLLEIIRWQINPETARTPFIPLFKEGDRDEFRGNNMGRR